MSKKSVLAMTSTMVLALCVTLAQAQTATSSHLLGADEAKKMIDGGKFDLVLDVRTFDEYTGPLGHLKGAKLIPIDSLADGVKAINLFKNKTVLVYCHSGGRSAKSAQILLSNGFTNVYDLDGGITGWKSKGYPTDAKASQN
jgi:rhodanese-related sulfurtransferase